jgi:hypothetical protein
MKRKRGRRACATCVSVEPVYAPVFVPSRPGVSSIVRAPSDVQGPEKTNGAAHLRMKIGNTPRRSGSLRKLLLYPPELRGHATIPKG